MNFQQLIQSMTPEIKSKLTTAIELGKWPDGTILSNEQKEVTLQAIIAWDSVYGETTDEPFRVQKGGLYNAGSNSGTKEKSELKKSKKTLTPGEIPVKSSN